jgi:hypothetical protein
LYVNFIIIVVVIIEGGNELLLGFVIVFSLSRSYTSCAESESERGENMIVVSRSLRAAARREREKWNRDLNTCVYLARCTLERGKSSFIDEIWRNQRRKREREEAIYEYIIIMQFLTHTHTGRALCVSLSLSFGFISFYVTTLGSNNSSNNIDAVVTFLFDFFQTS